MKKRNIIIVAIVMVVLVVSSVGVVFAAANPARSNQSTSGTIVFTAPSGIRWNQGLEVFEIFNFAGLTHISSDQYANATGDISSTQKTGYMQMNRNQTYHIMKDIEYVVTPACWQLWFEAAPHFGTIINGHNVGLINGFGHTIPATPTRTNSMFLLSIGGTIMNLNIKVTTDTTHATPFWIRPVWAVALDGLVSNCSTIGDVQSTTTATTRFCAFFEVIQTTGVLFNSVNRLNIRSTDLGVQATLVDVVNLRAVVNRVTNYGNFTCAYAYGLARILNDTCTVNAFINHGKLDASAFPGGIARGLANVISGAAANPPQPVRVTIKDFSNHGEILGGSAGSACGMIGAKDSGENILLNNVNYGALSGATTFDLWVE